MRDGAAALSSLLPPLLPRRDFQYHRVDWHIVRRRGGPSALPAQLRGPRDTDASAPFPGADPGHMWIWFISYSAPFHVQRLLSRLRGEAVLSPWELDPSANASRWGIYGGHFRGGIKGHFCFPDQEVRHFIGLSAESSFVAGIIKLNVYSAKAKPFCVIFD